ncbi:MAG: hypothetical protein CMJ85_04675 [Planctomycetes bacterium]|nr:hypothetical protein [Planctomycetota bacterium]
MSLRRAVLLVSFLVFCVALLRTAWIGDDALITMRTVHNWHGGHGMVWNVGERVQTFTHPLWMLVLSAVTGVTGEYFFTVLWLQIALSLATVFVVVRVAAEPLRAWAILVVAFSMAFLDYSTSGLENPLTHLLLALLLATTVGRWPEPVRPLVPTLLGALLVLNRLDHLLLVGPLLFGVLRPLGLGGVWRPLLIGFAPLIVWELFAVFYYGSPVPVTAYAKAFSTGIPAGELFTQGFSYLADSLRRDPLTLATIGLAITLAGARAGQRFAALGVVFYLAYTVKVGGCFMTGRFLAAPFLVACVLLASRPRPWPRVHAAVAFAVLLWAGALPFANRMIDGGGVAYLDDRDPKTGETRDGIEDERAKNHPVLGLFGAKRERPQPDALEVLLPHAPRHPGEPPVVYVVAAGNMGFVAGPEVRLLDTVLLDPLLARLPTKQDKWRIGHVFRRVPEGYVESLATGENRIVHPGLRRYYETLYRATRGPLLSGERLGAIWRLLTGADQDGLRLFLDEHYRTPPLVMVQASDLAVQVDDASPCHFGGGQRAVGEGGIEVRFAKPVDKPRLRIGLDSSDAYALQFLQGETSLHVTTVDTKTTDPKKVFLSGIRRHDLDVPDKARGYDRIRIVAFERQDGIAVLAYVVPID